MIRVFAFLAAVAALATGAVWLADRPGKVLITWPWLGREIETSVAVGLIAVLVLAFLAMLVWAALRFVLGLPGSVGFAARNRKRARGFNAISRGMVAIGAGDAVSARRHASDARKLIGNEPLALLLEAQAAQLSGDRNAAEATFKTMLDSSETRTLGLRGLFVEARRRGDTEAARAFADEAVRLSPSLAWANDALLEHYSATGNWNAARTAVERRAALRLSDKDQARRQRAVLLAAEALATRESEPEKAMVAALEASKLAPGLTPAASLAGRMLAQRGDLRKASRLLENAWKVEPHPDIAAAYLDARPGDSALDRLARATKLMNLRPSDPESALTVANAAIAARDFTRARAALAPLLAGGPTVRACLAMADLEEAQHGAAGQVREWLSRATRAPRDPIWVADGLTSDHWLPVSPIDGRLDAFVWMVPPAAIGASKESMILDATDTTKPEPTPGADHDLDEDRSSGSKTIELLPTVAPVASTDVSKAAVAVVADDPPAGPVDTSGRPAETGMTLAPASTSVSSAPLHSSAHPTSATSFAVSQLPVPANSASEAHAENQTPPASGMGRAPSRQPTRSEEAAHLPPDDPGPEPEVEEVAPRRRFRLFS
jgi:HemY protein